jgi:hypothetical protein
MWAEEPIEVHSLNNKVDTPIEPKPGYQHIPPSYPKIDAAKRDQFYQAAGLSSDVSAYDEVEKNVLYIRLRRLKLSEVIAHYPKIPDQKIKNAYTLLHDKKN